MTKATPEWFERFKARITWDEFNQNVHIDLVNKFVYVETAKVACSTIKARLYGHIVRGLPIPKEVHPNVHGSPFVKPFQLPNEALTDILFGEAFYRFTFVREPIERILSAYLDKIARPMPQKERFLKRCYPERSMDDDVTLSEFVDGLSTIKAYRNYDKHWRPQTELMFLPDIEYSFIGCINRFEEDWKAVVGAIGLDGEGRRTNSILWHATAAAEKISAYVTDDIRAKLKQLYADDIELFAKVLDHQPV